MNRNTVQRSPRGGGAGVDCQCSLPGGQPCGHAGGGAPGPAPPPCGHSRLAAGLGGAPLHAHTYTSGRGTGRHVSQTERHASPPRGPDPLPLAWGPASGTHPQHPPPCSPLTSVQTPGGDVLLCALTSDFTGGCPPRRSRSLCQRVHLQLQFIKFLVILPFNFQLSLHLERGTHHAY